MIRPLVLAICCVFPAPAGDAPPSYLSSRTVVIRYQTANAAPVAAAHLWVSLDSGATWESATAEPAGPTALRYAAPRDGRYDFYLVLENPAGASAAEPTRGVHPHLSVLVDTIPPLLQVHGDPPPRVEPETGQLVARCSLIEEHLGDSPVRVFYRRGPDGRWLDGGPAAVTDGLLTWPLPPRPPSRIDLRVTAADLAGNVSHAEILDLKIPAALAAAPGPVPVPTTGPAVEPSPPAAPTPFDPIPPDLLPPLAPDAPFARLPPAAGPPARGDLPPAADAARVDTLRRMAVRYLREGRYSLATGRFEEALRAAPDDPDLLVGLGSALYRTHRYDDAGRRFADAARLVPTHAGAVEGLALVAATERRYPDARQQLQRLLELTPNSARAWLSYGDVAHKLGDTTAAVRAWRHVSELPGVEPAARAEAQQRLRLFDPAAAPATPPAPTTRPDAPSSRSNSGDRDLRR